MKRLLIVLVAVVVVAGALFAWRISERGPSRPSVQGAVDRFRSSSTVPGATQRLQPRAGVYVYRGSGNESLSFLDTSQGQGPEEPGTVTTDADGCWTFEIEYNSFHRQTWRYCARDGRLVELGGTTDQRFDFVAFKASEHSEVTCDPPTTVADVNAAPGTTSPITCTGRSETTDSTLTQTGTVTFVGVEPVVVGGTEVAAFHSRSDVQIAGDQNGTVSTDIWFATADGLPLREAHDVRIVSPAPAPLNEVTYREQGTFELTSLTPRT